MTTSPAKAAAAKPTKTLVVTIDGVPVTMSWPTSTTTPPPPPPPPAIVPLWGAYDDDNSVDNFANLSTLQTFLQQYAPAGKNVNLSIVNTYTGGNVGSFTPLNGTKPVAGGPDTIVISLCLGAGIAPGTTTLFDQVAEMVGQYQQLANLCKSWGLKVIWRFYELNGNWQQNGYPASMPAAGVGYWVLYPPTDVSAAIAYLATALKAIDSTCLIDCNFNGNGPNNQLDCLATQSPAINRVPMDMVDIISCDNSYNDGNSQYDLGHLTPWIDLAVANKKDWAIPELAVSGGAVDASDAALFMADNLNLALGNPVMNRQTNVLYTPAYPALYVCQFDSDDNGQGGRLQDAANLPSAKIFATLTAV